ncbi:MAG: sel1 repeat family protein [Deltaproteobacteria bacterium]|nr:sel1 repeat family protein [Deltaproteobacteria bacterium]
MKVSHGALLAGVGLLAAMALGLQHDPQLRQRLLDWFHGDEGQVAREIADKVRMAGGESTGPVEVTGNEVRLLDGKLRLVISDRKAQGDRPATAHLHVAAMIPNGPEGGLDACIFGLGATRNEALSDAAAVYAGWALPPIRSLVKPQTTAAARLCSGTEEWGVPGFRGYIGLLGMGGSKDEKEEVGEGLGHAPLFSGLSKLPTDGRAHLLKVVLMTDNGAWRRTLELDGEATAVNQEVWNGVPSPNGVMSVVGFAAFQKRDRHADEDARKAALKRLDSREPWLFGEDTCPADAMPDAFIDGSYSAEACQGGRILDCLEECEQGAASSCYSAALEVEKPRAVSTRAVALFLRACRLGFASACTNVAATRESAAEATGNPSVIDDCSVRTYEAVCQRASDPWACTMFGGALLKGVRGPREVERAREVLGKSCKHGRDDPACAAAASLLKELDEPHQAQ